LCGGASETLAAVEKCTDVDVKALSGDVMLPAGCIYKEAAVIVASDTTLDCNGAVFDGGGTLKIGLTIDARLGRMNNITVRHCVFRNFASSGIRITLTGPRKSREDAYSRAPQNVTIESTTVDASGRVGIYVDDYVQAVTIKKSTISNSGSTAIYLEHSSRANQIEDNRFVHNGFGPDGHARREAVAVDSSAHNVIARNVFEGNGRGSIFLYKNCGEQYSSGVSPLRWQHSDENKIVGNRFINEKVGVWIASRQSMNLRSWDCGDASMDGKGNYFRDYADRNVVQDNIFCATTVGVRVEGDDNVIQDNIFDRSTETLVDIPLTKRGELKGLPPKGNVVTNSRRVERCHP
jgi:hypothetical protein